MKKWMALLLTGALCLSLTGCGTPLPPEKAVDGLDWDENWVTVGNIVGVDAPEGMTHRENNEALSANGMYYATWSMGDSESYINEDDEEVQLYEAQVYLLLGGYQSQQDAENTLNQWTDMARLQYDIDQTFEATYNGQNFTIITYEFDSEKNPYARGASAFGIYCNYAVSVELTCREKFDGDAAQLLGEFLDNCHYALP